MCNVFSYVCFHILGKCEKMLIKKKGLKPHLKAYKEAVS